jgi:ferrous iron transport protein A
VTLADLKQGQRAVVERVQAQGILGQRLLDLGLVPGTPVQAQFVGRGGSPVAYYVRGSLLALRRTTAAQVVVTKEEDWQ